MDSLPPNRDVGPGLVAELVIVLLLSLCFVLLRSYVRLCITKSWGWDDTTIVIAWIFQLIDFILMIFIIHDGVGQHAIYLSNPEQRTLDIVKWSIFIQISITLCTLVTKISICIMILRIQNTKPLRVILWTMMSLTTAVTITLAILQLVHCIPLKALWTPSIHGRCIPSAQVYNFAYVQSGFNIVADLCLSVSPIVILWNVKISRKKKTLICGLMSLGLTATICSALRNPFTPELLASQDYTHAIIPVIIVVVLEMGLGIIAACVPACMPILQLNNKVEKNYPRYGYTHESRDLRQRSRLGSNISGQDNTWRVVDRDGSEISLNPVSAIGSKVSSV